MVTAEAVLMLLNPRLNRVLLILQSSLSEQHQFQACRKLVLDEFGKSGLTRELEALFRESRKDR